MRGRKPRPLTLQVDDVSILKVVARSRSHAWFQVQHAQILLGVAYGQRVQHVAWQARCDPATVWRVCRSYEARGLGGVFAEAQRCGRPQRLSPPPARSDGAVGMLEAIAQGLHITHWSSFELARQAVVRGIVASISPRSVRQILHEVDLQPHRTRSWKTSTLDAQFKERAEKILWCYGNARYLAAEGLWVVCVDEIPNFQVLERKPIRRAIPGHIEQQEFEYIRHGTVNLLMLLIVHSGKMEVAYLPAKNAAHYIGALEHFRRRHRHLAGSFLIQDGDPSHTAAMTHEYFTVHRDWWRPRFTPVHASWLDQAELLIGAFGGRYLKRGSWSSRAELLTHVQASAPEYNRLYAHPFEWYWTNHQMRQWFARQAIK